ncbi:tetratricopeptide repeat protein [Tuwongella immobilis]|uniref:Ancillary SecYEG translocon subunit/Cell division coordinator CpoB TPR domain-containing protein n=1 Tax=Tuwongella immobilis TaxID=692036 RepID=A0A6C2YMR9_9BACT
MRIWSLRIRGLLGLLLFVAGPVIPVTAQSANSEAEQMLDAARRAANEQNYPFAATKFREYLQKFGNTPQAPLARYGMVQAMLESPTRDWNQFLQELQPLLNHADFVHRAEVLYLAGVAHRGLALQELAPGLTNLGELPQRRANAQSRFQEAQKQFAAATAKFTEQLPAEVAANAPVPRMVEWAARSRCDQAEMELRLNQPKQARATLEPFQTDGRFRESSIRTEGLYLLGVACYQLQDWASAGKALASLAPFPDAATALHTRYLLGKIHRIAGENAEATAHLEAVVSGYATQKKEAADALQQPDRFKNNPYELARLQALSQGIAPDYVAGALLELGVLQYEGGRFAEAQSRFADFVKQFPNAPEADEAKLRLGFCLTQLQSYPEAINTLSPLSGHAKLGDQASFWLAKAQFGQAQQLEREKIAEREQGFRTALGTFRAAADKAGQIGGQAPESRRRRGEILLALADATQLAGLNRDAIPIYEQILNEKLLPERQEECVQRYAVGLHLAGEFARSDQVCEKFLQDFPESTLRESIAFRQAENAYFQALSAKQKPDLPNRDVELPKLFQLAATRYASVAERFPDSTQLGLVRYGQAMVALQLGQFETAAGFLEQIPGPDRIGELGRTPYLLAECLIRQTPVQAGEDALADNMIAEKLTAARTLLEGFIAANPKSKETPDALIKLGYCMRRLALREQPPERTNGLSLTRGVYEKLMQEFPNDPLVGLAQLERAKTLAMQGDRGGAINELRKFTVEPAVNHAVAPLAVVQLATYLREQNQSAEAVTIWSQNRPRLEQLCQQSQPARPLDIGLIRYHHGVALQEVGQFAEARTVLDSVPQAVGNSALGLEALLRSGQCRFMEGRKSIDQLRSELAKPGQSPAQIEGIRRNMGEGWNAIRDAAQTLERRAEEFKAAFGTHPVRARMLYESAWAYRLLAEDEVRTTRERMQLDEHAKRLEQAKAKTPPGANPPIVPMPEIARAAIAMQPSEQKMIAMYQSLIEGFSELELAVEARFELGEMLAERGQSEESLKQLRAALEAEPIDAPIPARLTDQIRIRLGCVLLERKEIDAALTQFDVVAQNPQSTQLPQAQYRAGECLMSQGKFAEAAERLKVFRDQGPFQNSPGVTDRALHQLGAAYAKEQKWDESRQAYETLLGRFPNSPWVPHARYGIAWAHQSKGEFDPAVNWYSQVIQSPATELAARSHVQIGLCRLEQNRYAEAASSLLVVPYTYDFPELNPLALTEAARAFLEDNQTTIAQRLLKRVIQESPKSESAKIAQERLDALAGKQSK